MPERRRRIIALLESFAKRVLELASEDLKASASFSDDSEQAFQQPTQRPTMSRPPVTRATRPGPEHCVFPRCSKPHAGPVNSYMCKEHASQHTLEERHRYLATYKAKMPR